MKKVTMKARRSVLDVFKKYEIDSKSPIGVGVSGGADSASLLFALSTIYHHETAALVHVVIVDHQLQEITSKVSHEVATLASSLGFTPHVIAVAIAETSSGMEADARAARYGAFESVIEAENLSAFLIGHTKNDQAEQVMLGLLRGSGTKTLAGMPEKRDVFLRPYLQTITRKETQVICEENDYAYWSDPHNDSDDYRRVVVRKLLKEVEKETSQNLVEPLVRSAKIASEDSQALDFYASREFDSLEAHGWFAKAIEELPEAIGKRVVKRKLEVEVSTPVVFTAAHVESVYSLIIDWRGQKGLNLPGCLTVSRKGGLLIFEV